MSKKPSLFQRLTGSIPVDDFDDSEDSRGGLSSSGFSGGSVADIEEQAEAELTVDVHQTPDAVIVKTMAAGVSPDDLDVSITRDMVVIRGERVNEHEVNREDFYHHELYWGTFSRTILLPCEIEPDEATAVERHGLLIITLPKIDKGRKTKLKIQSR